MRGAIIGDVVGSIYEFNNYRSKDFYPLVDSSCFATDDSIMSLCVGSAIEDCYDAETDSWDYEDLSYTAKKRMQDIGANYPDCGYGGRFYSWIMRKQDKPYNSFGNGAAMRVTACGEVASSLDEAERLADAVTKVSHNHPEGIKGAKAVAAAIYLAKTGSSKQEIIDVIEDRYYPNYHFLTRGFSCDDIRPTYRFNETCQETVPQALECFFEASDFVDAIRNAISIGGDSDTIAAITGSVAEAYFGGCPRVLAVRAVELLSLLDSEGPYAGRLYDILGSWEGFVGTLPANRQRVAK